MLNTNKMTQRVLDAIQEGQNLAIEYQHQAVDVEHIFKALLTQENGLLPKIIEEMGQNPAVILEEFDKYLSGLPKLSGTNRPANGVYVTPGLDKLLNTAEAEAKKMKDEYISVEHILIAQLSLNDNSPALNIFKDFRIEKNKVLKASEKNKRKPACNIC